MVRHLSLIKIPDFNTNALRQFLRDDFTNDLSRRIEDKLIDLHDMEGLPTDSVLNACFS